jgi:hypothetical protein
MHGHAPIESAAKPGTKGIPEGGLARELYPRLMATHRLRVAIVTAHGALTLWKMVKDAWQPVVIRMTYIFDPASTDEAASLAILSNAKKNIAALLEM